MKRKNDMETLPSEVVRVGSVGLPHWNPRAFPKRSSDTQWTEGNSPVKRIGDLNRLDIKRMRYLVFKQLDFF